nr:SelT/SelW/SelH family protein [Puniceicoccus vermicola]
MIVITYCPGCKWLLRSAWMGQELLSTFEEDLAGVTLSPSDSSGVFRVVSGETVLWDRGEEGGFPEIKELKKRVRDLLAPGRDLGHIDRTKG